jgi:hypothetical protein
MHQNRAFFALEFGGLPRHVNIVLRRPEPPLLVGEALLLIRVRVLDLHRLPRRLGRRPRTGELHHAFVGPSAFLIRAPAAVLLGGFRQPVAQVALPLSRVGLRGDRDPNQKATQNHH